MSDKVKAAIAARERRTRLQQAPPKKEPSKDKK